MSEEKITYDAEKLCGLCGEKQSKYCCPRCSILYCSLDCYKSEKHAGCSESFYRDCVSEELASYQADDESKKKMIDILKKMRNEDASNIEDIDEMIENVDYEEPVDSDDEEHIDLQDRVKDLNLNDADAIWNALTDDERNEFEALVNQCDVGGIMPEWEPWWMFSKEKKLVEDVSAKDNSEEEVLKLCPVLKKVPTFSSLTSVQPSPAIRFNITNILSSYVFIMRYFNGELDAVEGTTYLLNICVNLDTNTNFEDPTMAVESVAQKCLQSDLIQTDQVSIEVMKRDTFLVLQGPSVENEQYYCKAALSHLHKLFSEAKSKEKPKDKSTKEKTEFSRKFPEHERSHLPNLDLSKVKKCMKKLEYYLSFIESYSMDFE